LAFYDDTFHKTIFSSLFFPDNSVELSFTAFSEHRLSRIIHFVERSKNSTTWYFFEENCVAEPCYYNPGLGIATIF